MLEFDRMYGATPQRMQLQKTTFFRIGKYMRLHITGNAGGGKSTFAENVGDILGIHVYGLDNIVWKEG